MEYYDLYHEILFRYTDVLNDKVPKQKNNNVIKSA